MLIFLDFSKAFDLVNHEILLSKMKCYNFHESSISWFTSYLESRTQKVCLGNISSTPEIISKGVPQGSVLGPLLFLLFINDLPLVTEHSETDLFADDATLRASASTPHLIEDKLQSDLNKVKTWCETNEMNLNVNKTKCMLLGTSQKLSRLPKRTLDLDLNGVRVENVNEHKVLGVYLDPSLQWEEQINHVFGSINAKLSLLSKIKKYLPKETRILYFNAYILPLFDYCLTLWGNCSEQNANRISKLQKKAARIILDKPFDSPSEPLFRELHWLDFKTRIKFSKSILVYKCMNQWAPSSSGSFSSTIIRLQS